MDRSDSKTPSEIERLIRPHFLKLAGYTPIEPLETLAEKVGVPVERLIKLDGNENPYGPSPKVAKALGAYSGYQIYPDPLMGELRDALSGYLGLPSENILLGAGSDELIDLIMRLVLEPGEKVLTCPPTFGMYRFSTAVNAGELVEVPRNGFEIDVDAVKQVMDDKTKLIFLASPNNPTGNIVTEAQILELLGTGAIVVVDEAYYEFSGETLAPMVLEHENLIVLRTFSKWAGLAGLRVGYGAFPLPLVPHIIKIKQPYNVSVAAQVAVRESLADSEYLLGNVKAIVQERERLLLQLHSLDFLEPYPSQANFILCQVTRGNAQGIKEDLEKLGIFIRYFNTSLLSDCIRISVGTPEQDDTLLGALRQIGGRHGGS